MTTSNNEQFLSFFHETPLNAYNALQDVFSFSDDKFDESTEKWLSSIASGIREDVIRALLFVLGTNIKATSTTIGSSRFLPDLRALAFEVTSEDEMIIMHGIVNVIDSDSFEVNIQYLGESIALIKEADELLQYIYHQDYKRISHFIIYPLLRHARMSEYYCREANKTSKLSDDELIVQRNTKIAFNRYYKKQVERVEAIALAEILWRYHDYEDFRHDEMIKFLNNEASDKKRRLLFPEITESYIRKDIAKLARKLGKRVLGE